ncbi:MAG: tetratricopeptide repeat protein [Myxococcota bacterium]
MSEPGTLSEIKALWKQGSQREALEALSTHLESNPSDGEAWGLRGLYLLDLDEPRRLEAIDALKKSLEIALSYPAAYNAGNALLDLNRLEEALEMYELSIRCFDRYPEAWVNRGIVLTRLGSKREGIESFDRALAIDAGFLPALRCKAIGLENLGDKSGSEAIYARMAELHPDNVRLLSEYGRALSRLPKDNHMELEPHGREWKAVEILTTVLERNPHDLAAWLAKAEVLHRCMYANVCFRRSVFDYVPGPLRSGTFQGDLVELLESAMQQYPKHPAFPRYMAELYAFRDDSQSELPYRERVCQLAPEDDSAFLALFELSVELGNSPRAADALVRAITLNPTHAARLDRDCPADVAAQVRQRLANANT